MPEDIKKLEERVRKLENAIFSITYSDRVAFQKTVQMLDGRNFQLGSGTGTKIGTAITQKLGFFGATPVDKPETLADPTGGTTQDGECRITVGGLIDRLQELGLMK